MTTPKGQKAFDQILDASMLKEYRRSNDLEVLGNLYKKYMHLVYGMCLKYLQQRESAQDAVLQIFEQIAVDTLKHSITNFKSWLYVVAKNYCLMELRKKSADDKNFKMWVDDQQQIMESGFDLHPIDRNEVLSKHLLECIGKLKDKQKESIHHFYFEKRCYREITELINVDEKSVKSLIQNAKRNLKLCLEKKNVE